MSRYVLSTDITATGPLDPISIPHTILRDRFRFYWLRLWSEETTHYNLHYDYAHVRQILFSVPSSHHHAISCPLSGELYKSAVGLQKNSIMDFVFKFCDEFSHSVGCAR